MEHLINTKMGQIGEQNSDIEVHVENSVTSDLQIKYDSDIQSKESKKKHKCNYPDCHAVFLRPSRLERHIRLHTGEVIIVMMKVVLHGI